MSSREMREVRRDVAALREHRLRPEAPGAVRRAHQRAREHAEEADALGLLLELDELLRLHPAVDGQVPRRRAQVLRDRDDVGAGVVEVLQRLDDLLGLFAHAEDEVRLRDEPGLARHREHAERALVAERRPDPLEDARHRLDVVREHLGAGVEDLAEQHPDRR